MKAFLTHLLSALDDIKRADSSVREAAGKDAADHALPVVAHVVNVAHCVVSFQIKDLNYNDTPSWV